MPSSKNTSTPMAKSRAVLSSFADRMQKEEQEKLDRLLASAVYACGTQFSNIENSQRKTFFKAIRPSYVQPSRYQLSNLLLDVEYESIRIDLLEGIAYTDSAGVMRDGWSNIRSETIVKFVVSIPKPLFWKSIHTELESRNREYICAEVAKVIEEIKACGQWIVGFVSDNASNIKKAWTLLKERYPILSCHGCASNAVNLIFKDSG